MAGWLPLISILWYNTAAYSNCICIDTYGLQLVVGQHPTKHQSKKRAASGPSRAPSKAGLRNQRLTSGSVQQWSKNPLHSLAETEEVELKPRAYAESIIRTTTSRPVYIRRMDMEHGSGWHGRPKMSYSI